MEPRRKGVNLNQSPGIDDTHVVKGKDSTKDTNIAYEPGTTTNATKGFDDVDVV